MKATLELTKWIRPHILEMKGYRSARDTFNTTDQSVVLLDANEHPKPTPYNRYPDPYQRALRAQLADRYGLDPSWLMLGNGSDEVLDLIIRASCTPGKDRCLLLPPTYGMYQVLSKLNALETQEIPLDEHFQPKVDLILQESNSSTKILFLCSPNNPTGNLLDADKIEQLLNGFDGLVVIDEAYIDFTSETSWVNRLKEFDNLIVVQTLSKSYGLAGIRLGLCYANPELIEVLLKIKPPYNINSATQQIALERLQDAATFHEQLKMLIDQRDELANELAQLDWVKEVFPSNANFLLLRVDDAQERYQQALASGFVLRNRHGLPGCDQCLRISVGTKQENEALIKCLKTFR